MSGTISRMRTRIVLPCLRCAGSATLFLALTVCHAQGGAPSRAGEGAGRADAYGDPLPPYAVARMGTVRFRQGDCVTCVAFTPDGKAVVSASRETYSDGTLRLWDAATGKELRRFVGPEWGVGGFAISPDGKLLASTSKESSLDATTRLWDLKTGKELHKLKGSRGPNYGVAFSPDGKVVAAAETVVRLWDVKTGKLLREFDDLKEWIYCLTFAPDGKSLVSGDSGGTISFWDVSGGKATRQIKGHVGSVLSLAFSPDGSVLASAGADGTLRQWKVATGEELRRLMKQEDRVGDSCLAVSPNGQMIAGAGGKEDGLIHLFAADTGKELKHFGGHVELIECLAFSPDGKTLASGNLDSTVRLWDVATGKELLPSLGVQITVLTVALSPEAAVLAVDNGTDINCYDAATGKLLRRLVGHTEQSVGNLAFAPDGKTLFSAAGDDTVRSWNVTSGEQLHCLELKKDNGYPDAFSPDRKTVAALYPLRLLDVSTGKELRKFGGEWNAVAFSQDGKALATANREGDIRLWEIATGKELRRMRGSKNAPRYLAFSPDGRWLATEADTRGGYEDVQLWNAASGEETHRVSHRLGLGAVLFSPDGRTLATGGYDRTILLWEVATGRQRAALAGHQGHVYSLSFSRDGRRLASGSRDATALLWDLPSLAGPRRAAELSAAEVRSRWDDLAAADAAKAYRAVWDLAASPKAAVKFLGDHLRPIPAADPKRLAQLLTDLDDNSFDVRDQARKNLAELAEAAEAALAKEAAAPRSAETKRTVKDLLDRIKAERRTPSAERLQALRAVEALEAAGTPEAREVLRRLAGGGAGIWLTQEAKASLQRLSARQAEPALRP